MKQLAIKKKNFTPTLDAHCETKPDKVGFTNLKRQDMIGKVQ